ncbi:hypothetical protein GALL_539300 [mine drainage metagenome]|uniref:Uncharacterized protein n=1 Tax=mine drainage metagenome TaxID=410659 RepID=A0A1J5P0A2_9ZZZZ
MNVLGDDFLACPGFALAQNRQIQGDDALDQLFQRARSGGDAEPGVRRGAVRRQPFADALHQHVDIEGLLNVVPGAFVHQAHGLCDRAVSRHENDGRAASSIALRHGRKQAFAVAIGQTDVAQDQRIEPLVQCGARLVEVTDPLDAVMFQSKSLKQGFAHDGVVLNQQNGLIMQDSLLGPLFARL